MPPGKAPPTWMGGCGFCIGFGSTLRSIGLVLTLALGSLLAELLYGVVDPRTMKIVRMLPGITSDGSIPGLDAQLFQRWLALFGETTSRLANDEMAERANDLARRIAESLWYGYQANHALREREGRI